VCFVQFGNHGCPLYNVALSFSVLLFVAAVPPPSVLQENVAEDTHFDYNEGSLKLLEANSGAGIQMEGKVEARDDAERSVVSESWPKDSPLQAESVRCRDVFGFLLAVSTHSEHFYELFLATDREAQVQFPALPEKKSSGSGTGSTQPCEYN
jgi:hypothetical protein